MTPGGATPNGILFQPGAAGIALTGLASSTGPGGVLTFTTPASLGGSPPYAILQAVGTYTLGSANRALPSGPRAQPILRAFLLGEISTQASQPGLWVDTITSESVSNPGGDGPHPQTWYLATIWATALAPNTTYTVAYLALFS